jgi:tetratricopeptide (TPR) repeat protein
VLKFCLQSEEIRFFGKIGFLKQYLDLGKIIFLNRAIRNLRNQIFWKNRISKTVIYAVAIMIYKQPKAHQLLGQLSQLSREDEKNEILMRRLRNEAESLVNQSGQPTDYIALGAIDTVLNNPVRVKETFNQGLEKYPNDSQLQSNYAVSLDKLGFVSEAMDYAQRAYESHQGDLLLLNHLIGHCIQSGHLTAAKHWLEQWQRLQPNEPHGYLGFVEKARELLLKSKVSDEAVAALLQISYAVLHDNGIYYIQERELSIEQTGVQTLVWQESKRR